MPESDVPDKAVYDYIVVGAGTAGATVAGRIAQNRTAKVLLIEHGGDPTLAHRLAGLLLYPLFSPTDYNFTTTGTCYTKQCNQDGTFILHAGKVLGGTSSIGIMAYERGNKQDYESWVKASNNSQWSLNNTLEYFKRTEKLEDPEILNSPYRKYHGIDGPLIVTKENRTEIDKYKAAFEELGKTVLDLNSNETLGFVKTQYTLSDRRQSSATAFLKASDKTPYIDILKHTEVTKILFDSNNNAIGVEAIRNNKKVTYKARKEVIVSAGVINSPKLLNMLSGIGPRQHLLRKGIKVRADLPVGENYHDHVNILMIHKLGNSTGIAPKTDIRLYPFPSTTGYVALNESSHYADYIATSYFLLNKYAAEQGLTDTAFYYRFNYCILNRVFKKAKGYKLLYSYVKNTKPKSRGCVTLRSSNYKDDPIIDTGIYTNEADLEDHVSYVQDYFKLGDTKVFKGIGAKFIDPVDEKCGEYEFGSREYWKCYALCMMNPRNYAVGTCAMGSVVDGDLKVIGVNRLRVVDASVIPEIPSTGTYAPTLMIGEKAADIILRDMHK